MGWRNSMEIDKRNKLKSGNAEPYFGDTNEGKCRRGEGKISMTAAGPEGREGKTSYKLSWRV